SSARRSSTFSITPISRTRTRSFFAHCDQPIGRRDHSDGHDLAANPVRVEAPVLRHNAGSFLPRISTKNAPYTGYTRIICLYDPHATEKRTPTLRLVPRLESLPKPRTLSARFSSP